jgi:hypothetical protein
LGREASGEDVLSMVDTGEALGKDAMGEDELSVVATGERVLGRVGVLSMVDTGGQEPGVGREASGEDVLSMVDTGEEVLEGNISSATNRFGGLDAAGSLL